MKKVLTIKKKTNTNTPDDGKTRVDLSLDEELEEIHRQLDKETHHDEETHHEEGPSEGNMIATDESSEKIEQSDDDVPTSPYDLTMDNTANDLNSIDSSSLDFPSDDDVSVKDDEPVKIQPVKINTEKSSVSVLSFNISQQDRSQCLKQIITILKETSPDLICFQELTTRACRFFESRLPGYQSFQAFITEDYPEGLVTFVRLSKYQIVEPSYYEYPHSKEKRHILDCIILDKRTHRRLNIVNTQLDSNPKIKEQQIKMLADFLNKKEHCIACGDFKIAEQRDDDLFNTVKMKDCWRVLGCPSQVRCTYDFRKNRNVPEGRMERPDRILFKGNIGDVDLYRLVGMGSQMVLPPSEHFGVLMCLSDSARQ